MDAFIEALRQAGWRYDLDSNGFERKGEWVSWERAQKAFKAAETGEAIEQVDGVSRTVAEVIVAAENDNVAQRYKFHIPRKP